MSLLHKTPMPSASTTSIAPHRLRRLPWLAAPALAAALVWQWPAQAQPATAPAVATSPVPAPAVATLGMQQVIERMVAQGYRDIHEVERKGERLYEVKARDPQGLWVELTVDGRNGEVLEREVERNQNRR